MDDFLDKLLNITSGFFKRMKLLFILDLISIFGILYSVFIILNFEYFLTKSAWNIPVKPGIIPPVLSFIIAVTCALLLHRKDRRINISLLIESKYPELKEKLRTAYDNRNEANIIVDSLKSQVSKALNQVSSSQLFAKGKMLSKVLIMVIFIAATVTLSLNPHYRLPPDTLNNISNAVTGNSGDGSNQSMELTGSPQDLYQAGKEGGGDIKGKPKIASIEGKNVDVSIYGGTDQGYDPSKSSQDQNQFRGTTGDFPVDVMGSNTSDGGYSTLMKKTETEKKLINDYAIERSKI